MVWILSVHQLPLGHRVVVNRGALLRLVRVLLLHRRLPVLLSRLLLSGRRGHSLRDGQPECSFGLRPEYGLLHAQRRRGLLMIGLLVMVEHRLVAGLLVVSATAAAIATVTAADTATTDTDATADT